MLTFYNMYIMNGYYFLNGNCNISVRIQRHVEKHQKIHRELAIRVHYDYMNTLFIHLSYEGVEKIWLYFKKVQNLLKKEGKSTSVNFALISFYYIFIKLCKVFSVLGKHVAYKNHDPITKVKVTVRGHKSNMGILCLVLAIT